MGRKAIGEAGLFARQVAEEIQRMITEAGGDLSGRWLQARTGRAHTYWGARLSGTTPFNVNDVETIATIFEMSPRQLIENAVPKQFKTGNVTPLRQNQSLEHIDLDGFEKAANHNKDSGEPDTP